MRKTIVIFSRAVVLGIMSFALMAISVNPAYTQREAATGSFRSYLGSSKDITTDYQDVSFAGADLQKRLRQVRSHGGDDYTWVDLVPVRNNPVPRRDHAMAVNEIGNKVYIFGGNFPVDQSSENDLWEFDYSTNQWREIEYSSPTEPSLRKGSEMVYDSEDNCLYLFGGYGGGLGQERGLLNDLWKFDLNTMEWSPIQNQGMLAPSGRDYSMFVFHREDNEFIVFGGADKDAEDSMYLWKFSLESCTWQFQVFTYGPDAYNGFGYTYDSTENKAYLFGGKIIDSDNYIDELWELDCNTKTWTELPSGATARAHCVMSKTDNDIYIFGGRDNAGEILNDLWSFHLENGQWQETAPTSEIPEARIALKMGYLSLDNSLFIFGGTLYPQRMYLNDSWKYLIADNRWQEITPERNVPYPSARSNPAVVFNSQDQKYYLFGGYFGSWFYNDLWVYDSGENGWMQLEVQGELPDPTRGQMSAIYDPVDNQMLLFGGFRVGPIELYNDVFAISLTEPYTCRKLDPEGPLPPARRGHRAIYNSDHHSLVLFGGSNLTGCFNDLWEFDIDTQTWHELQSDNQPPARYDHGFAYNEANNQLWMFGGCRNQEPYYLHDLWMYSFDDQQWSEIEQLGMWPEPRSRCGFAFDSSNSKLIVYSGYVTVGTYPNIKTHTFQDVWEYDTEENYWEMIDTQGEHVFRYNASCIYDPQKNRFVIYGGICWEKVIIYFDETWALNLPQPLMPPDNLRGTAIPEGADLAWDASSSEGVTGYKIYYGNLPGTYNLGTIDVGDTLAYAITGLTPSSSYFFAATAYNAKGDESGYSNEVRVIPQGEPPEWPAEVRLELNQDIYHQGDHFLLTLTLMNNTPDSITADVYVALSVFDESYYFWPSWCEYPPDFDFERLTLEPGYDQTQTILDFIWPPGAGEASGLFFISVVLDPATSEPISNFDAVAFGYE